MRTNHCQHKAILFIIVMLILASITFLYSCQIANARTIIVQPDSSHWSIQVKYASPIGQTFRAEDQHISSIGFWLEDFNPSAGPISVKIELFEEAGIDGQSLGSAPVEGLVPGFKGFYDADFSFVNLTVGEMYTAIISSTNERPGICLVQWGQSVPDPYVNGNLILQGDMYYNCDAAFRIIPEPASALLIGAGLVFIRKKR